MEKLLKLFMKDKHHLILSVLLSVFIIFDIKIPLLLAELVDNVIGKIVVFVIALCLLSLNVLSGAIGLIAAYVLVHRSERTTGSSAKRVYVPTETKKAKHLAAMNDFPVTVEEEVINNMLPVTNRVYSSPGYKPVLDSFHDSAEI
tara:strand:- start:1079 stop:1513 length:435 start_codon:yes stop_codon:yes gene_type:complete